MKIAVTLLGKTSKYEDELFRELLRELHLSIKIRKVVDMTYNFEVDFDTTNLKLEEVSKAISEIASNWFADHNIKEKLDLKIQLLDCTFDELDQIKTSDEGIDIHWQGIYITERKIKDFYLEQFINNKAAKSSELYKTKEDQMGDSSYAGNNLFFDENIKKIKKFVSELQTMVVGQEYAIHATSEALFSYFLQGSKKRNAPLSFLFVEPVNQNLSKAVAKAISMAFCRLECDLDGNDYVGHEMGAIDAFGINESYRNAKSGTITTFAERHPTSVFYFRNFECAHAEVKSTMTKMHSCGTITDRNSHDDIDFTNCIFIYSTAQGKCLYDDIDRFDQSTTTDFNVIKEAVTSQKDSNDESLVSPLFIERIRESGGGVILPDRQATFCVRQQLADAFHQNIKALQDKGIDVAFDWDTMTKLMLYRDGGMLIGNGEEQSKIIYTQLFNAMQSLKDKATMIKKILFKADYTKLSEDVAEILQPKANHVLFVVDEELWGKFEPIIPKDMVAVHFSSEKEVKTALKNDKFDAIFLDYTMKVDSKVRNLTSITSEGSRSYEYILKKYPDIPVYFIASEQFSPSAYKGFYSVREIWDPGDKEVLSYISSDITCERSCKSLARKKRKLLFDCEMQGIDKEGTVHFKFCKFKLERYILSTDKKYVVDDAEIPTVKFSDVIGCNEFKEVFYKDIFPAFKDPEKYTKNGKKLPRGILQMGPPGGGKTLCAKALAGEAGVPFISVDSTIFLDQHQGEGCKRIREIFRIARSYGTCIVFFDEIDTIGRRRTGDDSSQAREALTNTFLAEMDGFKQYPKSHVLVIGASNFMTEGSGALDPAFVRRFDYQIKLRSPDKEQREEFIKFYLKKGNNCVSEDTVANIAKRSDGRSPADLEIIIEHAFRRSDCVTDDILKEAFEEFQFGKETEQNLEEKTSTSYHECGHALVSYLLGRVPEYLTNVSRGNVGGYMMAADDDRQTITKKDLLEMVTIALGGRAAEEIVYGQDKVSAGASCDLKKATYIVKKMLTELGMKEGCLVSYDSDMFGSSVELMLFNDINKVLTERYEYAKKLLCDNRDKLEILKNALLEKGSLVSSDITTLLNKKQERT